MSQQDQIAEAQTNVAQCPTCKETYDGNKRNPRILDCGHTFCYDCLKQVDAADGVICRRCKKPSKGKHPKDLPWNFGILEAVTNAISAAPPEGSAGICKFHQQPLMLFCIEHNELCCLVCARYGLHKKHNVVDVAEAVKMFKPSVERKKESLRYRVNKAKDIKIKHEQCIDDLNRIFDDFLKKFDIEKTKIMERINNIYNEKLQLANDKYSAVLGKLQNQMTALNEVVNQANQVVLKSDFVLDLIDYIDTSQKVLSNMPEIGEPTFDFSATLDIADISKTAIPFGDIKIDLYEAHAKQMKSIGGQPRFLYSVEWKGKHVIEFDTITQAWARKEVKFLGSYFK